MGRWNAITLSDIHYVNYLNVSIFVICKNCPNFGGININNELFFICAPIYLFLEVCYLLQSFHFFSNFYLKNSEMSLYSQMLDVTQKIYILLLGNIKLKYFDKKIFSLWTI